MPRNLVTMCDTDPIAFSSPRKPAAPTISDTAVVDTPDAHTSRRDAHPDRRIDRWYATHHVPEVAVTGYRVTSVEDLTVVIDGRTVELTDHCPIEIDVDERALAA